PLVGEKTRVSGTGWSTSAAVALAASSALFGFGARAASTVRVAVAFYPICSTTEASELTGSVLFLPGGGDPLTPPDRCVRSVRRRKTRYRREGRLPRRHPRVRPRPRRGAPGDGGQPRDLRRQHV